MIRSGRLPVTDDRRIPVEAGDAVMAELRPKIDSPRAAAPATTEPDAVRKPLVILNPDEIREHMKRHATRRQPLRKKAALLRDALAAVDALEADAMEHGAWCPHCRCITVIEDGDDYLAVPHRMLGLEELKCRKS